MVPGIIRLNVIAYCELHVRGESKLRNGVT